MIKAWIICVDLEIGSLSVRGICAQLAHCALQFPVEASSAEVATEVKAVERSAVHLCPIEVVLERVIATPTGNVLACWQILGGSDPTAVRRYVFPSSPSISS